MSVLSTDEAFVLDVLLEATQPVQSPHALIRSLAEQLIETRKELTDAQKEIAALQQRVSDDQLELTDAQKEITALQQRVSDEQLEALRLKLASSSVAKVITPAEQDPDNNDSYW